MDSKHEVVGTGAWVRQLREEAGLTQAELARRLEVSTRTIARWEGRTADHPLSSGKVRRISAAAHGHTRARRLGHLLPTAHVYLVVREYGNYDGWSAVSSHVVDAHTTYESALARGLEVAGQSEMRPEWQGRIPVANDPGGAVLLAGVPLSR